jgi:hypothetical protein
MLVEYPLDNVCDIYRMLTLKTKHNIKSRDIVWLNKSFGEWNKKVEEVNNEFDEQDENEDEDEDDAIEEIRKESDTPVDVEEKSL